MNGFSRAACRMLCLLLALMLLPVYAFATQTETEPENVPVTEIYTPADLAAMADNPEGSFLLMNDLDMTGIDWKPVDFAGSFDGAGHAILNLTLSELGDTTAVTYDGNLKSYDTRFCGMFGTLMNAEVKNLNLINVRGLTVCDEPVFLGGLAGYAEYSTITDCTLSGTLELRAHDRQFGVGGMVGFGSGAVNDCTLDVTLICTDTDDTTRDEQFMGGVYATGFMDVNRCTVNIQGYSSEYGYAHNGGVTGMWMQLPFGRNLKGSITFNTVNGFIYFFEKNTNRRAYCAGIVGEHMASTYALHDNQPAGFERREDRTYAAELRPEMCDDPTYTEVVTESECETYGFTTYTCDSCGYTYTDHYTLPEHHFDNWTVKQAPTETEEGVEVGTCRGCGMEIEEVIPVLVIEPTEVQQTEPAAEETHPAAAPAAKDEKLPESVKEHILAPVRKAAIVTAGVAVVAALLSLIFRRKKKDEE